MSMHKVYTHAALVAVIAVVGLFVGRAYSACKANKECLTRDCFWSNTPSGWRCFDFAANQGYEAYPFDVSSGSGSQDCTVGGTVSYDILTNCLPCDPGFGGEPQESACIGTKVGASSTAVCVCN